MKLEVILLPLLILISGCFVADKNVECISDSGCVPAGCSGQICASEEKSSEIITTCEYREEYSCLKFTKCGCVDSKCAWNQNEEYLNCVEEVRV